MSGRAAAAAKRLRASAAGYSPLRTFWRAARPRFLWRLTSAVGAPTERLVGQYGLVVRRGPFAGLRYPPSAVGRVNLLGAKLLGSYEQELAPRVEDLLGHGFATVVNVGAGDGYYAVGLARRLPGTTVLAYEGAWHERRSLRRLAAANRAAVAVRGVLTLAEFGRLEPEAPVLLVVDVEGAESGLLRPDVVPWLRVAWLLVELHPTLDPALPEELERRFAPTHELRLVHGEPRAPDDYPERPEPILLDEGRGATALWALWTPREHAVP